MIVVRLFGGLGNQMFQYATARRLALLHAAELRFDLSWFDTQALRTPDLVQLRIAATRADDRPPLPLIPAEWTGASRVARLRRKLLSRRSGWHLVVESCPGVFDPSVLSAPDQALLIGYWQSERYFEGMEQGLRNEFAPRQSLTPGAAVLRDEILAAGGVSVHVRRGDYAANQQSQAHGLCPPEYYRRAMSLLDDKLGAPQYFVFSDDPGWVAEQIRHPRIRLVSQDAGLAAYEELTLMTHCRAHVTANSSFSWWGAWLGRNPAKTVIAPKTWFADAALRSDDIVPESWLRI